VGFALEEKLKRINRFILQGNKKGIEESDEAKVAVEWGKSRKQQGHGFHAEGLDAW
jgi:hypothetical protein